MSTTKKKRKKKGKATRETKPVHYLSLAIHRKWPNPLNYLSHLKVIHSNSQILIDDIDRILNAKWIDLQRPKILDQFNEIHQQTIDHTFRHQLDLYQSKYLFFEEEFQQDEALTRQVFLRWIELIDRLEHLYQQLERSERSIYEYRLDLLKQEFEQERDFLKDLFVNQHFKELDNQIHVLQIQQQNEFLQQDIRFQLEERQLNESFIKNLYQFHNGFQRKFDHLQSVFAQIIRFHHLQLSPVSKHCHRLLTKTRHAKDRLNDEITVITTVKKKIEQVNTKIDRIESKRVHLNDRLDLLKQCSIDSSPGFTPMHEKRSQKIFRRLCVVMDQTQKSCQRKLSKAERLLLLADQCRRLEFEDEHLLQFLQIPIKESSSSIPKNSSTLCSCDLNYNPHFEQLESLWKRLARVQMDLHLLRRENASQKQLCVFFQKELEHFAY